MSFIKALDGVVEEGHGLKIVKTVALLELSYCRSKLLQLSSLKLFKFENVAMLNPKLTKLHRCTR